MSVRRSLMRGLACTSVIAACAALPAMAGAKGARATTYTFSNIMMNGCDQLEFGVVINSQQTQLGTNAGNTCLSTLFFVPNQKVSVPAGASLLVYLHDDYCGTTYYSNGTGDADHAAVFQGGGITTRKNPVQVDIIDAGGACYSGGQANSTDIPAQGGGTLDLITNAPAATIG